MNRYSVLLILAALLVGCTSAADDTSSETTSVSVEGTSDSADSGFPLTIQNCGRELTFESAPQRAVTFYQPALELLAEVGVADAVVARTEHETDPLPELAEAIDGIPVIVEGDAFAPPQEPLLAADPDFVYSTEPGYDFDDSSGRTSLDTLAELGIPAFISPAKCPGVDPADISIEDVYAEYRAIGQIFGVPEEAEAAIAKIEAAIAEVENGVGGSDPTGTIVTFSDSPPLGVLAADGFYTDTLRLAGGENLMADVEGSTAEVSAEVVAASEPEAFVLIFAADPDAVAASILAAFPTVPAAETGKAFAVDPLGFNVGPRYAQTIRDLAANLHPDAFGG